MADKIVSVVTGANGFVGSHLVDFLLEKGHQVKCVIRKSSNTRWLKNKDVEICDCGLYDKEALKKVINGADYVYHVAGVVKSKKTEGYYMGNVEPTRTILDAALEISTTIKRIVIVSSATVCGPTLNGKPVDECSECHPITTYGKSKLDQENLAKTYMDKLPITICRAPAVYGERDTEIFIYFNTFNKGLLTSIGLKDKSVSLIHAIDLVRGFYLAAMNEKAVGQTYFITSERPYTWKEVGEVTSRVLSKKPFQVKVPHFAVYGIAAVAQFFSMFSSKPATLNIEKARDLTRKGWTSSPVKAEKELGFRQEISLEEGIRRTCQWYKEMKWI